MAHTPKSQHVGNHGGKYTDIDGLTKQFTYVDHDKKTKVSMHTHAETEAWSESKYRDSLISRILEQPASICPDPFQDFTIRGEGKNHVTWNTDMIIDKGMPSHRLRELATLLENRAEYMGLTPKIIKTY